MPFLLALIALILTLPITGLAFYKRENLPGIALCTALAVFAWLLGRVFPLAGAPVLGILLGMILANLNLPFISGKLKPGTGVASKKALQAAIVLLGFQMNLRTVFELGGHALLLIAIATTAALLTAYIAGRAIGIRGNEQTLIGVGTAICGGSAIAAVSPILNAKDDEVARSIATIFLFNVIAAFSFPLLGHLFGMTDHHFGMWAGSAINDTSSVVAASFAYSETAGISATVVKLTRTLMIIPFCILLSIRQTRKTKDMDSGFHLHKVFPWFVLGFIIASLLRSMGIIPLEATVFWGDMGRFLIVIAMTAIGLSCNIRDLIQKGSKPILLGACCALITAVATFGALHLLIF